MGKDIEIVLSMLESGHSVELPATGYSMFPVFSPGQRFIVRPFSEGEMPVPGDVVVCRAAGTGQMTESCSEEELLVMHRLVEIKRDESGEAIFITRGDSRVMADPPRRRGQMVGIVEGRKSGRGIKKVRRYLPGELRMAYNRLVLRVFWRVKRD